MKKLIVIATALFALSAQASQLPGNPVRGGKYSNAVAITPQSIASVDHTASIGQTKVTLVFGLMGCVDALGDVTYHTDIIDGIAHVYATGINLVNPQSMLVRCIAAPMASRDIYLNGIFNEDQIVLEALEVAEETVTPIIDIRNPPMTCMAYWSGYEFDAEAGDCVQRGRSGCSNPFKFRDMETCREQYGLN